MKNPLQLVDRRGLMTILGSAVLITLVSIIVIVLSLSSRDRRALMAESERREQEEQALSSSTSFGIEDFYRDILSSEGGVTYPIREPQKAWTDEVDFYWIDPAEAGLENLSSNNDRLIFESLGIEP